MATSSPPLPDSRPELAIVSDRYRIVRLLGRGGWADVYEAVDLYTSTHVAVKAFNLSETAERQLRASGKTIDAIVAQHARFINNAPNLVPRWADRDNNGVRLLISPLYDETLAERVERESKENKIANTAHVPSGLTVRQAISYATDLIAGIQQFHREFKEPHRDLKLENLVVDAAGKVLLNDFESADGTHTIIQAHMSRGHEYTRSPRLWDETVQASRKDDSYGFASVVFKLFTGNYLFEDELRSRSTEEAKQYMRSLRNPGQLRHAITKLAGFEHIPKPFQEFICDIVRKDYWHSDGVADDMHRMFTEAVETYEKHEAFKSTVAYKIERTKNSVADTIESAKCALLAKGFYVGLATIGLVGTLGYYGCTALLKPQPKPPQGTVILTADKQYKSQAIPSDKLEFENRTSHLQDGRERLLFSDSTPPHLSVSNSLFSAPTVYDTLAAIINYTAEKEGLVLDKSGMLYRYNSEFHAATSMLKDIDFADYIGRVVQKHRVAETSVAIRPAIFEVLYGPNRLRELQGIGLTADFHSFTLGVHQGTMNHFVQESEQHFFGETMKNIMLWMPERFR
jgi:serine/threonine protein kinase